MIALEIALARSHTRRGPAPTPTLALCALLAGCPAPEPCGGFCGPGTVCEDERCVPAPAPEAAPAPESQADGPRKRKRKRRGKRGRAGASSGASGFVAPDDSRVPPYDDARGQTIGEGSGSERLSDRAVRRHMATLEPAFNRCIARAAEASPDELGAGRIAFDINVEPDGKVSGVSVHAPKNLRVFGIVPCMRLAVHGSRFPRWDGPPMRVEYSFRVE